MRVVGSKKKPWSSMLLYSSSRLLWPYDVCKTALFDYLVSFGSSRNTGKIVNTHHLLVYQIHRAVWYCTLYSCNTTSFGLLVWRTMYCMTARCLMLWKDQCLINSYDCITLNTLNQIHYTWYHSWIHHLGLLITKKLMVSAKWLENQLQHYNQLLT